MEGCEIRSKTFLFWECKRLHGKSRFWPGIGSSLQQADLIELGVSRSKQQINSNHSDAHQIDYSFLELGPTFHLKKNVNNLVP